MLDECVFVSAVLADGSFSTLLDTLVIDDIIVFVRPNGRKVRCGRWLVAVHAVHFRSLILSLRVECFLGSFPVFSDAGLEGRYLE
jgi:hypothetical protein